MGIKKRGGKAFKDQEDEALNTEVLTKYGEKETITKFDFAQHSVFFTQTISDAQFTSSGSNLSVTVPNIIILEDF